MFSPFTIITIANSFPATPFSELLKMVAHFNQPPDCLTCRYFTRAIQHPVDWGEKDFCSLNGHNNPDQVIKFCAEWDPSPTQKACAPPK
jgi:hypothetical protein